jgi:integrase
VESSPRSQPAAASQQAQLASAGDGKFYDLRHTCVTLLLAQGAHLKAIQVHLGHSSIQVTMDRYGHLFPDAPIAPGRPARRGPH